VRHVLLDPPCNLLVYGRRPPTDDEWNAYLRALKQQQGDLAEMIVTDGAGPMRRQRDALQVHLAARRLPAAIVVADRQSVFKADLWGRVNRPWPIRVFRASALMDALAFLGIPGNQGPHIENEIARLRREVVGPGMAPGEPLPPFEPSGTSLPDARGGKA
jgi:hypothetical protein